MIWSPNIHLTVHSYYTLVHDACYVAEFSLSCAQRASLQFILLHKNVLAGLTVWKQNSLSDQSTNHSGSCW